MAYIVLLDTDQGDFLLEAETEEDIHTAIVDLATETFGASDLTRDKDGCDAFLDRHLDIHVSVREADGEGPMALFIDQTGEQDLSGAWRGNEPELAVIAGALVRQLPEAIDRKSATGFVKHDTLDECLDILSDCDRVRWMSCGEIHQPDPTPQHADDSPSP